VVLHIRTGDLGPRRQTLVPHTVIAIGTIAAALGTATHGPGKRITVTSPISLTIIIIMVAVKSVQRGCTR
jgi:hypothetical protein